LTASLNGTSHTATISLLASAATTGTAVFVKLDTTTEGNWKGVYGSNGYNVINDQVSYPSYVTVTPSGESAYTWASSTTNARAPQRAESSTARIAAQWYTYSSFVVDLAFDDTAQHQVEIYCLDWDTTSRTETVSIVDENNVLLNSQNVTNFHNGQYLVWNLSGHVKIQVTDTNSGANATISGLFFQ
jgi:hypothetical protein